MYCQIIYCGTPYVHWKFIEPKQVRKLIDKMNTGIFL